MKKLFFLILLVMITGSSLFSLKWGTNYWLLKPSEVPLPYEGSSYKYCYDRRFPDIKYEIYFDATFARQNGEWVYYQWYQDHGWWTNGRRWQGNGLSIDPIIGALYIDPYEKVAIYFFPNEEYEKYQVYRVRVLKN
jgi:hypothetical protein